MAHGLLYGVSYSDGVLAFTDSQGRTICNANLRKYLTLTATENNSSVKLKKVGTVNNTYQYRLNDGAWTNYTLTSSGIAIPLDAGDAVQWRCTNRANRFDMQNYVQFVMTGKIAASNQVTSIIDQNLSPTSIGDRQSGGYECYSLFSGCTSLTQAPELPATTVNLFSYDSMFYGCTSLTQAPELPATNLEQSCYGSMFYGCTSLAQAPALPATTLVTSCYAWMFENCISLTKSPLLPATVLANYCYVRMFKGCTNLNEVRVAATDISASDPTSSWLENVSSSGDFWCDSRTNWTTGISGRPLGWTLHNIADYPQT